MSVLGMAVLLNVHDKLDTFTQIQRGWGWGEAGMGVGRRGGGGSYYSSLLTTEIGYDLWVSRSYVNIDLGLYNYYHLW